jgi:hypothetical protein
MILKKKKQTHIQRCEQRIIRTFKNIADHDYFYDPFLLLSYLYPYPHIYFL